MIKFRDRLLFFLVPLLALAVSCKKDPPPTDPNDPYLQEFERNYLCNISKSDSNGTSWIYTNDFDYDQILSFKFQNAAMIFEGRYYTIKEIEELGAKTKKYIFQSVTTSYSQLMHCTINEDANTVVVAYSGYNDPTTEDEHISMTFSGTLSSSSITSTPDLEFSGLSGLYELTFVNDYIDDDFDTSYIDTVDVQFSSEGIIIGETGYTSLPFHSYYHHQYKEDNQVGSYLLNSYDYQITTDSIWVLDKVRLVVDSVASVWSDRTISGTKL